MNILSFFNRNKAKGTNPGRFSDFFINTDESKKISVFVEAAKRANRDQQEVFRKAKTVKI